MKKESYRGVRTVSWEEAIQTIQDEDYVMYRGSAFDEYDMVSTISMITTLAELKCEVDIFLSKKDGHYYLSRPMAKGVGHV